MPARLVRRLLSGHLRRRAVLCALLLAGCTGAGDDAAPTPGGEPQRAGAALGPAFAGIRWSYATEGPLRTAPAMTTDRIFLSSADGSVHALDHAGQLLWKTRIGDAVTAAPAVVGRDVIVQNRAGVIVALDARDGAVRWRRPTGADAPLAWGYESGDIYTSAPAVADGTAVIGSGDGSVYGVAVADGAVRWTLKTGGRVRASPALAGGVVYVGSMDGSVYAIDAATGAQRWRFDTEGRALDSRQYGFDRRTIQFGPTVVDGTVYVGARDGFLYAIDAATGAERWRFDHEVSWVTGTPVVWQGTVFAGSSDARFFHAVDAATGTEQWRLGTSAPVWSSPFVADGIVYFGDSGGTVHAVTTADGVEQWNVRIGGTIRAPLVPAGDLILVPNEDGVLYALATAASPVQRVVFWDSAWAGASVQALDQRALRDALAARGYRVADETRAAELLRAALTAGDAARTTLVFATDYPPPALTADTGGRPLLRAFLDAGGRIVWTGTPPLIWPRGADGTVDYADIDRDRPRQLLGVSYAAGNFDLLGARPTDAGRARGLTGWWRARWGADPATVDEVLATDETGNAVAWVKRYDNGGEFVMLGAGGPGWPDPALAYRIAERRAGSSTLARPR
ncbi:MAG TPA: PQQ-binding-like beta-propeller repeat protein [Longimicrobiales bacterium]|nr:PQQ-binding-like beta-propeller repeat protein [Longimicrobiales bacterium]